MSKKKEGLTRREFVRQVSLGVAALTAASPAQLALSALSTTNHGMNYRILGRTNLKISEVALGAGSISPSGANLIRRPCPRASTLSRRAATIRIPT